MSDEGQNLTPARPVAPRRRLSANPQMAQPMRPGTPERKRETDAELEQSIEREEEHAAEQQGLLIEAEEEARAEAEIPADVEAEPEIAAAPVGHSRGPVQLVVEDVIEPVQPVPAPSTAASVSGAHQAAPPPDDETPQFEFPKTVGETLARVDQSWAAFRSAALRFPSERMGERLAEGSWTRKQMLEHVAAWHDLTADRLVTLINTGHVPPFEQDGDAFNAAVARRAVGKTAGEVLKDMDATFNRLRRQMARLTDAQLAADEWFAAFVIGGNTYGHYEEHWADIFTPDTPVGGRQRR